MAKISKELNSILNENKDPVEENHSPLNFILLLILAVIAIYFAVMYFDIKNEKTNSYDTQKYKKIIKENVVLNEDNKRIKKELDELKIKKIAIKDTQELEKLKKENKQLKIKIEKLNNNQQNKSFKQLYFSENSKVLKCYEYESASTTIPSVCSNKFESFLNENQKALRFQVIPVLSSKDIKAFEKFDENTQDLLLNGVSTKRISELLWQMKKILGNDIILTSNSYYVKSKQDNSGFILKAYY
jgi:hypothetical protein